MHNFDKAKLLKDRHINISIEWGGTDLFTDVSTMSIEGVVKFLDILERNDEREINGYLDLLIQDEYDKR